MPIRSNQTSNDPILLNEVAASIWNEAMEGIEIKNLISNIAQAYNLLENSSELLAVKQFIDQMVTMELLLAS